MAYDGPMQPGLRLMYKPWGWRARTEIEIVRKHEDLDGWWWCRHGYQSPHDRRYTPPPEISVQELDIRRDSISMEEWETIKDGVLADEEKREREMRERMERMR